MMPPRATLPITIFALCGIALVSAPALAQTAAPSPPRREDPTALSGITVVAPDMLSELVKANQIAPQALESVPGQLYEAAAMDGASSWRRFRDVTLPMISPSIFFVVVINTIAGLQTFNEVYTAFFNQSTPYGTNSSLMYAIYIFQQAFTFFKFGYASALAWILFAIIGVITAIQIVVSRRLVYYEGDRR